MKSIELLIVLLVVFSCKKTDIAGFHDKPVVESYLFADSIANVKISKLIPFSEETQLSSMDVNKLDVTITDQSSGIRYKLSSIGDGNYENRNLIISEGKTYLLSFPYNGVMVTATTTIPEKPKGVTLSALSMIIPQMGVPGGGGSSDPPTMPSPLDITWTNNDQSYYLVVTKNMEKIKVQINTRTNISGDFFRNQPINVGSTQLNPQSFKYYGYHLITLFKIQPEYVIFFQETSNSSLSLTEINANITNGYGIFTGLNSFSAYLLVSKP